MELYEQAQKAWKAGKIKYYSYWLIRRLQENIDVYQIGSMCPKNPEKPTAFEESTRKMYARAVEEIRINLGIDYDAERRKMIKQKDEKKGIEKLKLATIKQMTGRI
mgnify:CR=1 FL=1